MDRKRKMKEKNRQVGKKRIINKSKVNEQSYNVLHNFASMPIFSIISLSLPFSEIQYRGRSTAGDISKLEKG